SDRGYLLARVSPALLDRRKIRARAVRDILLALLCRRHARLHLLALERRLDCRRGRRLVVQPRRLPHKEPHLMRAGSRDHEPAPRALDYADEAVGLLV